MKAAIQIILLLLIATSTIAQTNISGLITDSANEPLIGANVFIKGTYTGVSTDLDGHFHFKTDLTGPAYLAVTYIGYLDQEIEIHLNGKPVNVEVRLKESINKMDAVVITAGVFQGGDNTKSEVLKPLDIVTTAGATADIAGALNTLPGTQTVGEEGRLFVRGGSGNETKTYIDGLQVLSPYSTTIPNTPTRGRFSPFMFSGTSFSTGGYSAEYGQALSSALILTTKEKPTQTRTDLSLMTVGGEISHTQSWAKSSIAAQGAYYNMTPYFALVEQENDWVKAPESAQANLAVRQMIGNTGMLKVYGNMSTNNFRLYQGPNRELVDIKNNYFYGNASFKNLLGKKWSYHTGASITHNEDIILNGQEDIVEITKGGHLKANLKGDITDRIALNTGAELLYSESNFGYSNSDDIAINVGYQNPIYSAFAETDIYLSKNFVARLGARVEYTNLNENLYIAPRFSLGYKTGQHSQVAFAAGSFQQAAADDLVRINNRLDFEKADHLILNYQIITSKQTFRIEGYIKRYRDLVKFDPANPYNNTLITNDGNGYARGIDVFWRDNKTIRNADYWISYSYLDTERDYRDYPVSAMPTYASQHNLSVVYKHFVSALKTQFSGTYTVASPRPYNDPNTSSFNSGRTPMYLDLSLSVSYLATQSIIVYGSVTNVLGRENIFGYTYSRTPNAEGVFEGTANTLPAPRFIFLGVFITFSKDPTLNQLKSL